MYSNQDSYVSQQVFRFGFPVRLRSSPSLVGAVCGLVALPRCPRRMEFVPQAGEFKHNLQKEEAMGVIPGKWSKTSQLNDPSAPTNMRVKSGYTGHVPHSRDFIGGSYVRHDNPGTATKHLVPIMHRDQKTGAYPLRTVPAPEPQSAMRFHDPYTVKGGDNQHEYGATTTAPVPARIEKVLSADKSDLSDEQNRAAAFITEGPGQWLMSGYTGHVSATTLRACGKYPSYMFRRCICMERRSLRALRLPNRATCA